MITANAQRFLRPHAGDVVLSDWQALGLAKPSIVRARRVWTAEERDFAGPAIGNGAPATLESVKAELRLLLR